MGFIILKASFCAGGNLGPKQGQTWIMGFYVLVVFKIMQYLHAPFFRCVGKSHKWEVWIVFWM